MTDSLKPAPEVRRWDVRAVSPEGVIVWQRPVEADCMSDALEAARRQVAKLAVAGLILKQLKPGENP